MYVVCFDMVIRPCFVIACQLLFTANFQLFLCEAANMMLYRLPANVILPGALLGHGLYGSDLSIANRPYSRLCGK